MCAGGNRRIQASKRLAQLQHQFSSLAQAVQQHAEIAKQHTIATAKTIAYDKVARQKVSRLNVDATCALAAAWG